MWCPNMWPMDDMWNLFEIMCQVHSFFLLKIVGGFESAGKNQIFTAIMLDQKGRCYKWFV